MPLRKVLMIKEMLNIISELKKGRYNSQNLTDLGKKPIRNYSHKTTNKKFLTQPIILCSLPQTYTAHPKYHFV